MWNAQTRIAGRYEKGTGCHVRTNRYTNSARGCRAGSAGIRPGRRTGRPSRRRALARRGHHRGVRRRRQLRRDRDATTSSSYTTAVAPVDVSGWSVQYASAAGVMAAHQSVRRRRTRALVPGPGGGGSRRHRPAAEPGRRRLDHDVRHRGQGRAGHRPDHADLRHDCGSATACTTSSATARTTCTRPGPRPACPTPRRPAGAGGADTDNNAADFTAGAAHRRSNSGGRTRAARRAVRDPRDPGLAHLSPMAGQTRGRRARRGDRDDATASGSQDPQPDADPATSEGIFVFTMPRPRSPSATR